jgi:hypothetical protein
LTPALSRSDSQPAIPCYRDIEWIAKPLFYWLRGHDLANPYFSELASAFSRAAAERDWSIRLCDTGAVRDGGRAQLASIVSRVHALALTGRRLDTLALLPERVESGGVAGLPLLMLCGPMRARTATSYPMVMRSMSGAQPLLLEIVRVLADPDGIVTGRVTEPTVFQSAVAGNDTWAVVPPLICTVAVRSTAER